MHRACMCHWHQNSTESISDDFTEFSSLSYGPYLVIYSPRATKAEFHGSLDKWVFLSTTVFAHFWHFLVTDNFNAILPLCRNRGEIKALKNNEMLFKLHLEKQLLMFIWKRRKFHSTLSLKCIWFKCKLKMSYFLILQD